MSPDPDFNRRELNHLLACLCDGHADENERRRLEEILAASKRARRTYLHYLDLHLELAHRSEGGGIIAARDTARIVRSRNRPRWKTSRAVIFGFGAIAATLVISAVMLGLIPPPGADSKDSGMASATPVGEPIAMVRSTRNATWNRSGAIPAPGTALPAGAIQLTRGEIALGFLNGAEITIGAPADFIILSGSELYFSEGRIAAHVPPSASGFTIRSHSMALVDIGTEFAMNITPVGIGRVIVNKGEVVGSVLGPDGSTLLDYHAHAGDAFEINTSQSTIAPADMRNEKFVSRHAIVPPPLSITPAYVKAVMTSNPLAYWRFESFINGRIPNETGPRFPASRMGDARIGGSPGNHVAIMDSDSPDSGFIVEEPIPDLNGGAYSIELWALSGAVAHSTAVALLQRDTTASPPGPGSVPSASGTELDYLSVIEFTGKSSRFDGIITPDRSLRFLHRSPPSNRSGFNVFSKSTYTPHHWHHLVAVQDIDSLRIFIDGRIDQKVAQSSPFDTAAYQVIIGRLRPPGFRDMPRPFTGRLDEIAVYDRALTEEEVKRHFSAVPHH